MYKVYFTPYNYNEEQATFIRLFSAKEDAVAFCKSRENTWTYKSTILNNPTRTYYLTTCGCYFIKKGETIL